MRRSLRDLADIQYGKSPSEIVHEDGLIPVVGTGGVYGRAIRPLYQGPAIVVPRKGSLGNPQYMSEPFWAADTTYVVLPKNGANGPWVYYNLANFDLTKLNEATGVPSINRDWLYKIQFEDPGEPSQKRIAEILSTVDEAIEQTEALIAKTQQIKSGLMHDLFTRGVTDDGQLRPPREEAPQFYKDSPLGWIPKEWELKRCSDICVSVIDCKNRTPPGTEADGHPVIRTPNVRDGEFVWADLAYTDPISYIEWTARGRPVPGDVVITREAPVGEVCMIPDDVDAPCLGQRMMLYRPDANVVLGSYLVQVLQSARVQKHLDLISGGSTVGHVKVGDIRNLLVPWTALPEQELIAENLEGIREQLLSLRADATKLRQAKAGLMHDLLSGRIPVVLNTPADTEEVAAYV